MNKIMFAGASGTGKSTLAEWLANGYELFDSNSMPFVSGSVSDLLPKTKEMSHKDMLARDPMELYHEDMQILNLRHKKFQEYENFVSDRSYLDSAAYFLYKQADKQPECEVEHFLELCKMLLNQECTHLIFIRFHTGLYKEWITEDNGKRIVSSFFQMEISAIMEMILKLWGLISDDSILEQSSTQKITFRCPVCGKEYQKKWCHWITQPYNNHVCPECANKSYANGNSSYSVLTQEWLEMYNIKYLKEYKFEDCINKRQLRFDFYVKWKENIILIEVDGMQHYYLSTWTTPDRLKQTQENDKIKDDYCRENGYVLIRIPYWLYRTDTYKNILYKTFFG